MKPRKTAQSKLALSSIPFTLRCQGDTCFVRDPDNDSRWLVLGRAIDLPLGQLAEVPKRGGTIAVIEVDEYVAERVIHHRPGSYSRQVYGESSRWVLATFTGHPELEK